MPRPDYLEGAINQPCLDLQQRQIHSLHVMIKTMAKHIAKLEDKIRRLEQNVR